jgi:hypothetical protein
MDNIGVDFKLKAENENGNCITGFIRTDCMIGLSAVFLTR